MINGVDHDRKLLRELVGVFIKDTPKLISRVERAVRRGDATHLQAAAHALKGSVGNFDLGPAFEAVRRLEVIGRENRLREAPLALAGAKNEVSRLIRMLKAYTKTG